MTIGLYRPDWAASRFSNYLIFCSDIEVDPITKVNHVLTGYLMDYLNASVKYSVVNSWGYKNDLTGEWRQEEIAFFYSIRLIFFSLQFMQRYGR